MKVFFKKISISFLGLSIFMVTLGALSPEGEGVKVKSAYLVNFIRFIQWPDDKSESITIGFLGETMLEDYLNKSKSFAEKRAKIKINTIHFNSPESVNDCDVLYCADPKILKREPVLEEVCKDQNILTVTSKNHKFPENSCINFVIVNNKLRFEINNDQLKENKLKASAQLLKLSYKR